MAKKNRFLFIDLSRSKTWEEEPDGVFCRKFLGGRGWALPYLLKNQKPKTDPLSPENILVVATSVISGARGPAMPRVIVCAKSPLTGAFGESEAGGYWAPELNKAGFSAVFVLGKAPEPVYVWIKDGSVEIKKASHLWGKETGETQALIRNELDDNRARVLQIGPAGENGVLYANIVNELAHFNGRNGLGAVMGSKHLKALVVRGTKEVPVSKPERVKEINAWTATEGLKKPAGELLRRHGTLPLVRAFQEMGVLPTRNWTRSIFWGGEKISAENLHETIYIESKGCFACPIRCKRRAEVNTDKYQVDPRFGGPEFETVGALGSILEIADPYLLAKANELCNRYALDTISLGMTVGWLMEAVERGLVTPEECDGLDVRFGNGDVLIPLIKKIVNRQGIGEKMAMGSKRLAREMGLEEEEFLMEVKGQEVPLHDPRAKTGVGLGYALADYGADHLVGPHDTVFASADGPGIKEASGLGIFQAVDPLSLGPEKVRLFYYMDLYWRLIDMLGFCTFGFVPRGPIPLEMMVDLVRAITGWPVSLWELLKAGERTIHLARIFNMREGLSVKDDRLPARFFKDFEEGALRGKGGINKEQFEKAREMRYGMMGWDPETGRPLPERLYELDLGEFVDEL